MNKQMELVAEERVVTGKQVRHLRRDGIVPANMNGRNQPSVSLQVNSTELRKLLDHGGSNVIFLLKVGKRPPVQAIIKNVQHEAISRKITHVEFYVVAATETLKTHVRLHFVNEAPAASVGGVTVLRSLDEVTVECLPADLPSSIEVDLSRLKEVGDVIRVGDLNAGPGVTILTDANNMVAGLSQQAGAEKAEEAEAKTEETTEKTES